MKDLIKYVSTKYAADWKRIGHFLEMETGTLRAIERNFPSNVNWCCDQMFERWLEMDTTASWAKVFDAIDCLPIQNEPLINISAIKGS